VREAVIRTIDPRPTREHFNYATISKYPKFVTRLIFGLLPGAALGGIHAIGNWAVCDGSQAFGEAVSSNVAMTAIGFATVLSAEIGQIVFSLALATSGTSQSARRLLITGMAIATIISLVGYVQTALPGHENSPFAWLEASHRPY
jgi:hypothetical protein